MTISRLPRFLSTGTPAAATPPPLSLLLVGSDARANETIAGSRADAILAVRINPAAGRTRVLSVMRDTRVDVPGYGVTKINHALMLGGPDLVEATVGTMLEMPFRYHVVISYPAAARIIDALGGVTIENPEAFTIQGETFAAGTLHLDGSRSVLYARYRGGSDGDIGRVGRQQQVLTAMIALLADAPVSRLMASVMTELDRGIMTDFPPRQAVTLFSGYRDVLRGGSVEAETIPYRTSGLMADEVMGEPLWMGEVDPAIVEQRARWLRGEDENPI